METRNRQVTVNDEPTKNRLFRFCEKQIDQWLKAQLSNRTSFEAQPAEFRVEFTEDDESPGQVSCLTQISSQGTNWRGYDLASDTQQAFMHSLKRLQPH